MKLFRITLAFAAAATLSACGGAEMGEGPLFGGIGPDKGVDRGINAHHLSTLVAGVWVDPEGCDHWIIDDGVEGYLSPRLTPDGLPVCSGIAPPETATGPFKDGSPIPDFL